MTVTFQQLQYLIEANKAGSISQAAKNLFLTPSSVSVAVTALEQELGYPVFVRTAQGLIPTTEGEKVLKYASRILENYHLLDGIQPNQGTVCLNLGDHDVMGGAFAKLVEEYRENETDFVVSSVGQEAAIQKLLVNEIDLDVRFVYANRGRKLESAAENQGLAWQILATVPAAARVGPGHPLYHAASVTPKQLEQEILIEPMNRPFSGSNMLRGFMTIDPKKVVVSACSSARRQMISAGLGYFIIPLVPDELDIRFELHRIPIEGLEFRLYAIHNPRYPMRLEAARYLELLHLQLTPDSPMPIY